MLIRFTVSNFMSFADEQVFSMVASNAKIHGDSLYDMRDVVGHKVLPSSVIYGANASGKSNLIKAVAFAQELVVFGTRPNLNIDAKPFKLKESNRRKPCFFEFEFVSADKFYSYGIAFTSNEIVEEWLVEKRKTTDRVLFDRKTSNGETSITFPYLEKKISKKDLGFLGFVAKGTRPNQPFLTESRDRNVSYFESAFLWFSDKLHIVFPEDKHDGVGLVFSRRDTNEEFKKVLSLFDTGIETIQIEKSNLDEIPDRILSEYKKRLKPGTGSFCNYLENGNLVIQFISAKEKTGELVAEKIYLGRTDKESGKTILFDLHEESDGTRRIMDFIPIIMSLGEKSDVFIENMTILIDEVDRSLHSHVTRNLFKMIQHMSSSAQGSRSQVIATTHESSLIDSSIFRRDQIWFVDKDKEHRSKLSSLEEFKVRPDKDIYKDYNLGRFGGVPNLTAFKLGNSK